MRGWVGLGYALAMHTKGTIDSRLVDVYVIAP